MYFERGEAHAFWEGSEPTGEAMTTVRFVEGHSNSIFEQRG